MSDLNSALKIIEKMDPNCTFGENVFSSEAKHLFVRCGSFVEFRVEVALKVLAFATSLNFS